MRPIAPAPQPFLVRASVVFPSLYFFVILWIVWDGLTAGSNHIPDYLSYRLLFTLVLGCFVGLLLFVRSTYVQYHPDGVLAYHSPLFHHEVDMHSVRFAEVYFAGFNYRKSIIEITSMTNAGARVKTKILIQAFSHKDQITIVQAINAYIPRPLAISAGLHMPAKPVSATFQALKGAFLYVIMPALLITILILTIAYATN